MSTCVPLSTWSPPAGSLRTTWSALTEVSTADSGSPSVRPTCSRASWACFSVRFLRFGTVTLSGPVPTVMVTVSPRWALVLPCGLWDVTCPFCCVVEGFSSGVTLNPASVSFLLATAVLSPTTPGTEISAAFWLP